MKKYLTCFLLSIPAGLAIGLGGFLYILMTYLIHGDLSELGNIFGSLVFSIGLLTVCIFSLNLYTGKVGLIYESKKNKDFYISLLIMLIGNALGAFLLGYICYFIFKDMEIYNYALNTANKRLIFDDGIDYLSASIKSFLCGVCVYLAVKCFNMDRMKPLGITLLVFFVFIFVYSGWQHCIANMFYFAMSNKIEPNTFINLALAILFNSLGPVVGVYMFKLAKK